MTNIKRSVYLGVSNTVHKFILEQSQVDIRLNITLGLGEFLPLSWTLNRVDGKVKKSFFL